MSIFVCGDIHGTFDINKLDPFMTRNDLNEKDYLIICGDTGICGFSKDEEAKTRAYLRNLPVTILFCDGNHERFDTLNSYPIDEWHGGKVHMMEPGIIHLMRGQLYEIEDKTFFAFGGAYSIDRLGRQSGETWFPEELPSEEEYAEGWKNLKAQDYTVDYVITHTAPYEVICALGYEIYGEALEQVRFFQKIADRVKFREWYFGHFHEDTDLGHYHCRMDKVTQLQ